MLLLFVLLYNRWCCSKHNDVGLHLQRSACFLTYWRCVCVGGIHYARNVLPYRPGVTTGLQRALQESKLFPSSRFSWSWRWPEVLCWQRNLKKNSPRMGGGMEVGSASDIFPRWTFPMILKTAERVLTWWSCCSPISPAPRHISTPPPICHSLNLLILHGRPYNWQPELEPADLLAMFSRHFFFNLLPCV